MSKRLSVPVRWKHEETAFGPAWFLCSRESPQIGETMLARVERSEHGWWWAIWHRDGGEPIRSGTLPKCAEAKAAAERALGIEEVEDDG